MKQIYDYISYPWQVLFQALDARLLAQGRLEYIPQKFRDIAEVGSVDVYRCEGPTGHIELVPKPYVDV